jgi:hypothetical protein
MFTSILTTSVLLASLTCAAAQKIRVAAPEIPAFRSGFTPPPAPVLSSAWRGEEWGEVVLRQVKPGEYEGTYTDTWGTDTGRLRLIWSPQQQRFLGTWREGTARFGDISLRLAKDGKTIRGAYTTDARSKIRPANPKLADLQWDQAR